MKNKYVVFDLDDTLLYELDFLASAYQEIAAYCDFYDQDELASLMFNKYKNGDDVFDFLSTHYTDFSKNRLLELYRNHFPYVNLIQGAYDLLIFCKNRGYKIGLITDGRSITQRNKLMALGIIDFFDRIVISEEFGSTKPDERNFTVFQENLNWDYYYIGDNTKKDFITPNYLGWCSICLLDMGKNIHYQDFNLDASYLPKFKVKTLEEVIEIIT